MIPDPAALGWVGGGWIGYERALSAELYDTAAGTTVVERVYTPAAGHQVLADVGPPLAGSPDLRFRLVTTGGFTELNVDEIAVACALP